MTMNPTNDKETRLQWMIRDNMSPEAVAVIAAALDAPLSVLSAASDEAKEVKWFRQVLVDLLGGEDAVKILIGDNK